MLISYLCGVVGMIQILSCMIGIGLGAHIFITHVMNLLSSTCEYEANRKQIVIPRIEKILCTIFILLAMFVPSNLKWDLVDSYKKDLEYQKQETQKANEQIMGFKIFMEVNKLEDKFTEFDTRYKQVEQKYK